MGVLISNRQNKYRISLKNLRKKSKFILSALGCHNGELSIVIVDDPQIEIINRQYLNRSRPTNVLAFPMQEGSFSDINPFLLGDVVISAETCDKEAKAAGIDFNERFDQLLVHGILHLFGYDHENDEKEASKMEKKSVELLKIMKD